MKITVRLLVALLAIAMIAAGCGDDDEDGGAAATTGTGAAEQLETIEDGILTVGSDIPYKPFEFGDPPDYDGFDVDVVNAIGEKLGLEVRFVRTPFDTIFRDLAQGRFDMVASAVTITEERQQTVDFSAPYFNGDQSLMIKEGSDIRNVADLEGEIVGAQIGTTGADYARDETPAEDVRTYDLIDDAFQALQGEQVAAVINDFPVSKFAERSREDLRVVQTIETGEQYGLAFARDNDALREAVDGAIAEIKQDGTYEEIYREWFEEDPPASLLE